MNLATNNAEVWAESKGSVYQYLISLFVVFSEPITGSKSKSEIFWWIQKRISEQSQTKKGKISTLSKPGKKDDIPVIKPKNPEQKNKGMEIPEVQEAMKSNIPSLENKGD